MTESSNASDKARDSTKKPFAGFTLDLPVDSAYHGHPPRGTWMDGYLLSLMGLDQVKDRPQVFDERDARMCSAEFRMGMPPNRP